MRFFTDFYKNKKVLVTGHSGFKGTWMCKVLEMAGADVTGYALEPPTSPNLFEMADLENKMNSIVGDIRDLNHLKKVFEQTQPEIVIHMAAQPIVRESCIHIRDKCDGDGKCTGVYTYQFLRKIIHKCDYGQSVSE